MPFEHPYPFMDSDLLTTAYCWRIDRTDGVAMGFTSHDQDLVFDSITYEATTGFSPSAIDSNDSLAVDNLDVDGILSSDKISEADIVSGKYDFATVKIYLVDWTNISGKRKLLRRGTIGRVTYTKNGFVAEIRGLIEAYQQRAGKVYQKTCRATLGDSKCGVDLSVYTQTGAVADIFDDVTIAINRNEPNGYYDYGYVKWASGENKNTDSEIKTSHSDGTIEFYMPPAWEVKAGDTFSITAGCDRNYSTCINRFNNRYNFRGEPLVPGTDYLTSYPNTGTSNTVTDGTNPARGE